MSIYIIYILLYGLFFNNFSSEKLLKNKEPNLTEKINDKHSIENSKKFNSIRENEEDIFSDASTVASESEDDYQKAAFSENNFSNEISRNLEENNSTKESLEDDFAYKKNNFFQRVVGKVKGVVKTVGTKIESNIKGAGEFTGLIKNSFDKEIKNLTIFIEQSLKNLLFSEEINQQEDIIRLLINFYISKVIDLKVNQEANKKIINFLYKIFQILDKKNSNNKIILKKELLFSLLNNDKEGKFLESGNIFYLLVEDILKNCNEKNHKKIKKLFFIKIILTNIEKIFQKKIDYLRKNLIFERSLKKQIEFVNQIKENLKNIENFIQKNKTLIFKDPFYQINTDIEEIKKDYIKINTSAKINLAKERFKDIFLVSKEELVAFEKRLLLKAGWKKYVNSITSEDNIKKRINIIYICLIRFVDLLRLSDSFKETGIEEEAIYNPLYNLSKRYIEKKEKNILEEVSPILNFSLIDSPFNLKKKKIVEPKWKVFKLEGTPIIFDEKIIKFSIENSTSIFYNKVVENFKFKSIDDLILYHDFVIKNFSYLISFIFSPELENFDFAFYESIKKEIEEIKSVIIEIIGFDQNKNDFGQENKGIYQLIKETLSAVIQLGDLAKTNLPKISEGINRAGDLAKKISKNGIKSII